MNLLNVNKNVEFILNTSNSMLNQLLKEKNHYIPEDDLKYT
jgi:hypothetical protein